MHEDRASTRLKEEVSRRKLLKILAASGTAIAASAVLPGKWMKPVVNMGVLPAHAQQSGRFSIGNFTGDRGSVIYNLKFNDPEFNVNASTTYLGIWRRGGNCVGTNLTNMTISNWGATITGTAGRGKIINASSGSDCGPCEFEARAQLFDNGRESNQTGWITVPDDPNACNVSASN